MAEQGKTYVAPSVVDHGTLVELTQACAFGNGGDAAFPSGSAAGISFGRSSPMFNCKSD